jgi:Na+-driven multidrug efflux pump
MSEHGLRVTNVTLPIVGFQIVVTNFFQSISKAKVSIFLSLSRQLLFLLPVLLVLPRFYQLDGVWLSFPISDTIAFLVAFAILWKYLRKITKQQKHRSNNG